MLMRERKRKAQLSISRHSLISQRPANAAGGAQGPPPPHPHRRCTGGTSQGTEQEQAVAEDHDEQHVKVATAREAGLKVSSLGCWEQPDRCGVVQSSHPELGVQRSGGGAA